MVALQALEGVLVFTRCMSAFVIAGLARQA
jgi:hypothetical protein